MENENEPLTSYPYDTAPDSTLEAQNTTIPRIINEEHSTNTNKSNQKADKLLKNAFCHEREYDTTNETVDDINKITQKYEQNTYQNSEQKNIIDEPNLEPYMTEQNYNLYEEYDVQNDRSAGTYHR